MLAAQSSNSYYLLLFQQHTLSALSWAASSGHIELVEFFLKLNEIQKTIDAVSRMCNTTQLTHSLMMLLISTYFVGCYQLSVPLMIAARSGDQYVAKLLMDTLGGYVSLYMC